MEPTPTAHHTINLALVDSQHLQRILFIAADMIREAEAAAEAAMLAEAENLFNAVNIEFGRRGL